MSNCFALPDTPYHQDAVDFYCRHQGLPRGHLSAVALTGDGRVWAGGPLGLACFDGQAWQPVGADQPQCVLHLTRLLGVGDALWIGTTTGVARLEHGAWTRWWHDAPAPTRTVRALAADRQGWIWALIHRGDGSDSRLTSWDLWRYDGSAWAPVEHPEPNLRDLAAHPAGGLVAVNDRELVRIADGGFEPLDLLPDLPADARLTCLAAHDETVAVGTTAGLVLIESGRARLLTGRNGLPVEQVTGLVFGPDGALWVADSRGVARLHQGGWRYYSAGRWLPAAPASLAPDPEGGLWAAGEGVSHLHCRPFTLADKERHYERIIVTRTNRHHFVSPLQLLDPRRPEQGGLPAATDNDGLRTGIYLGAAAMRYSLTKSEQDQRRAREAFAAMLLLEAKTGLPGFPARAVVKKGEQVTLGSGEWHESPDPEWLWKGDTSSDETAGHYYGYYAHFRYGPDQDRKQLRALVSRISGRILDAGYLLPDYDGQPTRWARWEPSFLYSPEGADQTRLNSLEILSHMKVAHYITGEQRFQEAYQDLLYHHQYLDNVRGGVCLDLGGDPQYDDHLAFLTWYPLLQLEDDPELAAIYREAVKADWERQRLESNVLFNYIYGSVAQGDFDSQGSLQALRDIPLDLTNRPVYNLHRSDLKQVPGYRGNLYYHPLPWPERPGGGWGDNFYRLEGGGDGHTLRHGSFWQAAYWLGRLHGFIT